MSKSGPSKATPKRVKQGSGIMIPEKTCEWCVGQEVLCQWHPDGCTCTYRLCRLLKKPCITPKKWKAVDEEWVYKRQQIGSEEVEMSWEGGEKLLRVVGHSGGTLAS